MTFGEQNTLEEGVQQLSTSFNDYGINFIDTAEIYPVPTKAETQGRTDQIISTWLKTINRSKLILATKIAGYSLNLKYMPGREGLGTKLNKKQIKISVNESLKRLNIDYIDLLQLHWPERYVPLFGSNSYNIKLERSIDDVVSFEEQLLALNDLIQEGKVRYVGLSNETPYGVMKFSQVASELKIPTRFVSIQNSYSLLVRSDFENGLTEVCSKTHENVGLLAYSPLAGGILTGKYAQADCPPTSRLNLFPGYMGRYKQSLAQEAVEEYRKIATKFNMTPTELSLAWAYQQPHVASTIIGATTMKQLKENIMAYSKKHLINDDVLAEIDVVYKKYRDPSKL